MGGDVAGVYKTEDNARNWRMINKGLADYGVFSLAVDRNNPKVVRRNHLAQAAIERAQQGDFSATQRLLTVLERPFDEQPAHEADAGFPPVWAGTLEVSCSS